MIQIIKQSNKPTHSLVITFVFVSLLSSLLFFGTFFIREIWPENEFFTLGLHLLLLAIATIVFLSIIKIEAFILVLMGIVGPFISILIGGFAIGGTAPAGPVILVVTMIYAGGFILGLVGHRILRKVDTQDRREPD